MSRSDIVAIVDYGMGNLGSIANMIRKLGGRSGITSDPGAVAGAAKLILPGVGAFDAGMQALDERGLIAPLNTKALQERIPVLGICLGVQLMSRRSDEGKREGLGWFGAETRAFRFPDSAPLKVPHMGWNAVDVRRPNPLMASDAPEPWRFYFVHSYHLTGGPDEEVLCTTTYGSPFPSGLMRGNLFGVQFHPEKSHAYGMRLLGAFLEL